MCLDLNIPCISRKLLVLSFIGLMMMIFFNRQLYSQNFSIKLLNLPDHELEPGVSGTYTVSIENHKDTTASLLIKSTIPGGWSEIMKYNSMHLEPGAKSFKINSFYIPETAETGTYTLYVDIFMKPGDLMIYRDSFQVQVKAKYHIALSLLQDKSTLFAGDTLSFGFMLHNKSNLLVNTKVAILNGPKTEYRYYELIPDSFIVDRILINTPKDIDSQLRKNVLITAEISGNRDSRKEVSFVYEIFPTEQKEFDVYERYPIKISALLASNNDRSKQEYSTLFDVSGNSWISQEKKRFLNFQFKGPDRRGDPILGTNDAYYLRFSSPNHSILIGDYGYSLTKLTENGRLGRGIAYTYSSKKNETGAYVTFPRFYPKIRMLAAAHTHYKLKENLIVSSAFLFKQFSEGSPAGIVSVGADFISGKYGSYESEIAVGMRDNQVKTAIQSRAKYQYKSIRLNFGLTYADPDFYGYYSDTRNLTGGFTMNLSRKIQFGINYLSNSSNLALDTLYANAPNTSNAIASLNFKIIDALSINLDASYRQQSDKMEVPSFNFDEQIANIGINSRFKRIDLSFSGGYGQILNHMTSTEGEILNSARANANFRWNLSQKLSLDAFLIYMQNKRLLVQGMNDLYYGGGFRYNGKRTNLSVKYQSNYQIEEFFQDRSLLNSSINIRISPNHEIAGVAQYNLVKNSFQEKTIRFYIKYTYVFQAPIRKKKNIGSLEGRIINKGIKSVGEMMLSFGGNIAISDKDGYFSFPAIPAGENYLLVNDSKSGLHAIAETPGPYKIAILPGTKNYIEISYTLSASVFGKIVIEEDTQIDGKNFISSNQKLENVIIEVKKGEEIFRVISNSKGEFEFNDLRPGEWDLKVYKNGIPSGFELVNDEFSLNLLAGESRNLEIKIKKTARKVKFQQTF